MEIHQAENHRNKWNDSEVESHWDKVAEIYIQENNKVKSSHDQRFRESIGMLALKQGIRLLNISSRDCEADDYIKSAVKDVIVVNAEISQQLINVALKLRPQAHQVKISGYSELPFSENEFNRIITLETLEHVSDPIGFLSELYRVSTQDARMVLSCPPISSEIPYRIYTFLFGGHGEGPHRFLRSSEVKAMLKKTGWKLITHKGTLLIPVGPSFIQKFGEKIIRAFQNTFISELGIRQFYVCEKY
jgi:SAM-dependent methyltransferase